MPVDRRTVVGAAAFLASTPIMVGGATIAGGWQCWISDYPRPEHVKSALGVIKGALVDIWTGPSGNDLVFEFRTLATYKGPQYPTWEVLWQHDSREVYNEGQIYLAPIMRIDVRLRGDLDYDYYGEFPAGDCYGRTHLFKWSTRMERDVIQWLGE